LFEALPDVICVQSPLRVRPQFPKPFQRIRGQQGLLTQIEGGSGVPDSDPDERASTRLIAAELRVRLLERRS